MWKNLVQLDRPQKTIWLMLIACWIPRTTNTQSEYVTVITFHLQQWLHERTSMLRYTYIAYVYIYYLCGFRRLVTGLSSRRPGVRSQVSPYEICRGQVTLGQVFLKVIRFSLATTCWGNRREGDHWWNLRVDGRIILGWISRRWDVGIWTGLGWPRIETDCGRLWVR